MMLLAQERPQYQFYRDYAERARSIIYADRFRLRRLMDSDEIPSNLFRGARTVFTQTAGMSNTSCRSSFSPQ